MASNPTASAGASAAAIPASGAAGFEVPASDAKLGHSVRGQVFHVGSRYSDLKYIGEGAYGMVVSAHDRETNTQVAIKKVFLQEHLSFTRRTLREIKILSRFRHECIVKIIDLMTDRDERGNVREVYLVLNLMETDLSKVLKCFRNRGDLLPAAHTCFWVYQILRALKYIHSANVLHRDLKPHNILLNPNSDCDLKICDFGLSRVIDPSRKMEISEYVATRWYRAPEVMLNPRQYTTGMDIWSVGCIFGEMLSGRPLFPGKNAIDQLNRILTFVGSPSEEDVDWINMESTRKYVLKQPFRLPVILTAQFPNADPVALDLLSRMLCFNPDKRISAAEALCHPYFVQNNYHDPQDEPISSLPLSFLDFESFDTMPMDKLKEAINQEVLLFKEATAAASGEAAVQPLPSVPSGPQPMETDGGQFVATPMSASGFLRSPLPVTVNPANHVRDADEEEEEAGEKISIV